MEEGRVMFWNEDKLGKNVKSLRLEERNGMGRRQMSSNGRGGTR